MHKSFVSTSLNIIHPGCTFHLSYPYWTNTSLWENTMSSMTVTVHKSFVSTSLNIIHPGCTFHLSYLYWTITSLWENTMSSITVTLHKSFVSTSLNIIHPGCGRFIWLYVSSQLSLLDDYFIMRKYNELNHRDRAQILCLNFIKYYSTSLNIIHPGCTFHLSYPYWTNYFIMRKYNELNDRDRA